jgi:hypothetical protein
MAIVALRILAKLEFPSLVVRLWDGSGGPFVDGDGNIWRACVLTEEAFDQIEMAINAEAFTLSLSISGIDPVSYNAIWNDYLDGEIIGAKVTISIQELDRYDQPIGDPDVKFTGTIDNLTFDDVTTDDKIFSTINVEICNRLTLRTLTSGVVLSDVDQKARAKILNPGGTNDKFAERVTRLVDQTVKWPNL